MNKLSPHLLYGIHTKWRSNSKCFVLKCIIWLAASWIVPRLSEYIFETFVGICNSWRREVNQSISANTTAMLLYSASVELLETTFWLWENQDTMLAPKYIQYPVVDFRSSVFVTQSASLNPIIDLCWLRWMMRPWFSIPTRYRSILFTARQWCSCGQCMNWQTLFTTNESLGRVIRTYCRAPTTDLYKVGSWAVDAFFVSLKEEIIGVGWARDSSMFVQCRISLMYLVWERCKLPYDVVEASIPRK